MVQIFINYFILFYHLLNWNWFKFDTNLTVDLRKTTILIKNRGALSWESFHEFYCNYLLPITSLHGFCLHTFFPMNNTFPHIRTKNFSHFHSPPSPPKNTHTMPLPLVSLLSPLLEFILFVQWKVGNPSFQSMASSSFMNQWKLRRIFLSYGI